MTRSDFYLRLLQTLTIRTSEQELVPLRLNVPQQRVWKIMAERLNSGKKIWLIILKARREGISTLIESLMVTWTATVDHTRSVITAHEKPATQIIQEIADRMIDYSPLRHGVRKLGTTRYFPFRSSQLSISTAGSPDAQRGNDITCFHGSEVASWPFPAALTATIQCIPTKHQSLCILESTAKGKTNEGQLFYDLWCEAYSDPEHSAWLPVFLPWYELPDYEWPNQQHPESWVYGPDWTPSMNGEVKVFEDLDDEEKELKMRFTLRAGQLAWRRYEGMPKCKARKGSDLFFHQEYPSCLTLGNYISTEKGIMPIGECIGRQTESGTIRAWGAQPISRVYVMTTRAGRILRGTGDHPVATPHGFTLLSNLRAGERVHLRPPRFADQYYEFPKIDESWGRLIGYYMGDGSWYAGHSATLSIVCDARDDDVVEDVGVLLKQCVGVPHPRSHRHSRGPGAIEWRLGCNYARPVWEQLHLIEKQQGRWKRAIHVPPCILRSPRSVVREFLRGLFEADGSATQKMVRWATKHLEFARQVQLLLLGFGINAKIHKEPRILLGKRHVAYCIQLSSIQSRIFHDDIGFVGVRKRQGRFPQRFGVNGALIGCPPKPNEMVDVVKSVKADGWEVTYDLTVEPDHVFSANGILTHNTPEEAFISSGIPFFLSRDLYWLQPTLCTGKRYRVYPDGRLEACDDGPIELWKLPEHGHEYVIGADSSMGIADDEHSRSAIEIVDMKTMEQVGEVDSQVAPHVLSSWLAGLGRAYGEALIAPEVNASGGGGGRSIIEYLIDRYEYFHLHRWRHPDAVKQDPGRLYGWETNVRTRPRMLAHIREVINDKCCIVHSRELARQLADFGQNAAGKYEATSGYDDLVFAWGIALCSRYENYHPWTPGVKKDPIQWDELGLGRVIQPWELEEARFQASCESVPAGTFVQNRGIWRPRREGPATPDEY